MARGKYADVCPNLPRDQPEDAPYQDRINMRKGEIVREMRCTASALAHRYRDIRRQKEELERQMKDIDFELTAVSQLLVDKYEEEGTSSIRLDDGSAVSTTMKPHAKVVDKEAFRLWCIENGLERSLQLHSSTTDSLVAQRLLDGLPTPPGVEAFTRIAPRLLKG
jgi:hypothetical protein